MTKIDESVDELIDAHGGIVHAIDDRLKMIGRRALEGKNSPLALVQLAYLRALCLSYRTPKELKRAANEKQCGPRD